MDQWLSVDQSYIAPHTRALAVERIVKKHEGHAPDPAAEGAAERALVATLAVMNRALAEGAPYLTGDTFTLADTGAATQAVTFNGGGGTNTLVGANLSNAWNITAANAGTPQAAGEPTDTFPSAPKSASTRSPDRIGSGE